jgi:hypothetical protein
MKLDQYNKLRTRFELFSFEKNFFTLDKVLYYFSFLGNIFLVLFSYFFIKDVTNTIPHLFPGQDIFFSIFIILFMTGYELFKRFAFEQLTVSIIQTRLFTLGNVIGMIVCGALIAGSFYLSLNGAHRLVDTSAKIETITDQTVSLKADSVANYWNNKIQYQLNQPARTRVDRQRRDSIVNSYEQIKEAKIQTIESKTQTKTNSQLEKNKQNDVAFVFMTFFLELIILIGVAFDAFYNVGSFQEMKQLLTTPKYKQLDLNLKLLKLYYQNGRKKEGDQTIAFSKLESLARNQKLNCYQKDIRDFVGLCTELDIVKTINKRTKEYAIPYEKAKELLESQEML